MLKHIVKMIFFIGITTIIASCAAIERPMEFAVVYPAGVYKAVGQVVKNEWQRDNTSSNCGWKGGQLSALTYYQAPNGKIPWTKLGTKSKFSFNSSKTRLFHRLQRNGQYKIAVFVDIKSDNCIKPGNLLFIQEKYTSEQEKYKSEILKFEAKHFSLEFGGEKIQPKSIEMKFDNSSGAAKLYLYFSEKYIETTELPIETKIPEITPITQETNLVLEEQVVPKEELSVGIFHGAKNSKVTSGVGANEWLKNGACAWKNGKLRTFKHWRNNRTVIKIKNFKWFKNDNFYLNLMSNGTVKLEVFLTGNLVCLKNRKKLGKLTFTQKTQQVKSSQELATDNFKLKLAGNMITPNALEIKQVGNNLQAYLTFNDNNITNTFKIFSKQYPFKLVMSYSDADKSVVYDIIEVKHKVMKIRLPEIGDKNWNLVGYKYGYNLWEKKFSQQVITDQTIKFIAFNEFNDSDFRKRELSIITNSGAFVSILTGDNSLNQVIKNVVVGNSGNYDWHIPNTLVGDWVKITAQKVGFYEKSIFIWIIEDKIQDAEGNVIKQNQLDLSLIEKS